MPTTDQQDKQISELFVRHIEAAITPMANGDVFVFADDGDAVYLVTAGGDWGRVDPECADCHGSGYRPELPGQHVWCACVKPDDQSGEWA